MASPVLVPGRFSLGWPAGTGATAVPRLKRWAIQLRSEVGSAYSGWPELPKVIVTAAPDLIPPSLITSSRLAEGWRSAGLAGAWRQHDLTQSKNSSSMAEERVNRKLAAILAADVVGYISPDGGRRGGYARRLEAAPGNRLRSGRRRPQRPHREADRRWHHRRVRQRGRCRELRPVGATVAAHAPDQRASQPRSCCASASISAT